jgi:[ribosomal protein S5]-alanine N-acetyltransferase
MIPSRIALAKEDCYLRPWQNRDKDVLAQLANNRAIWLNMRDVFPSPYTVYQAQRFIAESACSRTAVYCAIAQRQQVVGSITLYLNDDIRRFSGVLSYWIGQPYWGKGFATAAISAISHYAFQRLALVRLYAKVFSNNEGSIRALEKCGFEREGYFRKALYKEGQFIDQVVYAKIQE